VRRAFLLLILCAGAAACRAPSAPATAVGTPAADEATATRLRDHVRQLAVEIGPRCGATNATYVKLEAASSYIQSHFEWMLRRATDRSLVLQRYEEAGKSYTNVGIEIAGRAAGEIVVVGAHYDSFCGAEPYTPGADDNASGVAVLLELARRFDERQRVEPMARSLRFVAFANEEPPYFQTGAMGSLVYAQQCQRRSERVVAMLSLEMLGTYRDEEGSQTYPRGIERLLDLPKRGDFLAIVGNLGSRSLVDDTVGAFRRGSSLPVEGLAAPFLPQLGWSDNWAFWQAGYAAVMATDTAMQRNPNYHGAGDTADTLDYRRMAMAADGLTAVVAELTGMTPPESGR
jgi:Zn-dependent M28 family amino/carboxypeptidase